MQVTTTWCWAMLAQRPASRHHAQASRNTPRASRAIFFIHIISALQKVFCTLLHSADMAKINVVTSQQKRGKPLPAKGSQARLLGADKPNGAKARSFGEINLPSSQATLSYRVAVATDAPSASAWRRGLWVLRGPGVIWVLGAQQRSSLAVRETLYFRSPCSTFNLLRSLKLGGGSVCTNFNQCCALLEIRRRLGNMQINLIFRSFIRTFVPNLGNCI